MGICRPASAVAVCPRSKSASGCATLLPVSRHIAPRQDDYQSATEQATKRHALFLVAPGARCSTCRKVLSMPRMTA